MMCSRHGLFRCWLKLEVVDGRKDNLFTTGLLESNIYKVLNPLVIIRTAMIGRPACLPKILYHRHHDRRFSMKRVDQEASGSVH